VSETTGRPLPLVTIENEFFWTSGSDGRLRFQECENFTINCLSWIEALGFCGIGEAGPRQVADAKVGVVSSGGLTPSGVILLRTDT
jgi:hypothetical protein